MGIETGLGMARITPARAEWRIHVNASSVASFVVLLLRKLIRSLDEHGSLYSPRVEHGALWRFVAVRLRARRASITALTVCCESLWLRRFAQPTRLGFVFPSRAFPSPFIHSLIHLRTCRVPSTVVPLLARLHFEFSKIVYNLI